MVKGINNTSYLDFLILEESTSVGLNGYSPVLLKAFLMTASVPPLSML